jgi:hypothetical protein
MVGETTGHPLPHTSRRTSSRSRWLTALGLTSDPPPHSLHAPWWNTWTVARQQGTPDAIAAAAEQVQTSHRLDENSPFFHFSAPMEKLFSSDQRSQLKNGRLMCHPSARRGISHPAISPKAGDSTFQEGDGVRRSTARSLWFLYKNIIEVLNLMFTKSAEYG